MPEINLSEIISPTFYNIHKKIKLERYTHFWLKGGRGSTKSSFISIEIILGMMRDSNANAMVLRKVGLYLRESVFEQLLWAIEALGVNQSWDVRVSPMELKYIPTGQRIIFRGADKPKKIKSTKLRKGYFKFVWFEEVDEFNGMEEIRTINQTLMRGGTEYKVFYSYNPPKSMRNWVNGEVLQEREDRVVCHSTYLSVPKEWLGEQFHIEAEHLKRVNELAYRNEYLGEPVGTGGEVFGNLTLRAITQEEIENFTEIRRGIDFGYAVDPVHYGVCNYDRKHKRLYIFYEIHKVGMSNRRLFEEIQKENINNGAITADSAEPKSIDELKSYGLRVKGAKKGPDSVAYGIKFLQDLEQIIIDPIRCPNTAREFSSYELDRDANGNFKDKFPDRDNHSIDETRYALADDMNNKDTIIRESRINISEW